MNANVTAGQLPRRPSAGRAGLRLSLRAQFSVVIALLAFVPNLGVTLASAEHIRPINVVWMLLIGLLSAAIGFILSGTLLRPLSRLENEVVNGTFEQPQDIERPHPDDPSEIVALRGAFGGLLGRLGIEQGRRNAFMATLVHDLKTPLIATGHLTQALTTLPLPDHERREVGAQIQAETSRLLGLVQQMADAHRFERDDVHLSPEPTDLRPLLDSVAARLAPQLQARRLQVQVHGQGHADVDPAALSRAVTNLAENAVRYAETRIDLLVTPGGVSVANDGPPLGGSLEQLAQPFNAQPATIAGQQYTAGTAGLGLFIARRIAEAHGGRLDYRRAPLTLSTSSAPALPDPDAQPFTLFDITLPEVKP